MPIVDKRDRNNWYNCIPVEPKPGAQWIGFSADKLKGNEIRCGDAILAKIPQMKGLISFKSRKNEYGGFTRYVELITERRYDPEKKQSRNKRVCIGIDISHIYRGMMIINEKYHDYFNRDGQLTFHPLIEKREKKKKTETKPTIQEQSIENITEPQQQENSPEAKAIGTKEEEKEAEQMDGNDQEIQKELEHQRHIKDRFEFLNRLLERYKYVVDEQLLKKQDRMMSRYQIRQINKLLKDIREFLEGFEYEDYLQLAEEPDEENGEGMSYGDMAILLRSYECSMNCYLFGRIWYKA